MGWKCNLNVPRGTIGVLYLNDYVLNGVEYCIKDYN